LDNAKVVGVNMWVWTAGLEAASSSWGAGRNHQTTTAGV